ncbi:MAG: SPFH domain-containing protein [Corynebacterium sp.]|nr:SPFH domain-containing protein [Corynebacterium sp.]
MTTPDTSDSAEALATTPTAAPAERTAFSLSATPTVLLLIVSLALIAVLIFFTGFNPIAIAAAALIALIVFPSIRIVSPGHTYVVQFFGQYKGTLRRTGLNWILPFAATSMASIRVRNFETASLKVNDSSGNPVMIGAIVVWQIEDTSKATFAIEDAEEFIRSQAESALRHVATTHPYSTANPEIASLSGSTELVSQELAAEVSRRVELAGLKIIEARISSLSYAPEIAGAMLQRQQAQAVVDARETIVEGAVSMVDSAIAQLEEREVVELDPERRATMVSNLMVVLCSDKATQPIVNTGSLYN